MFGPRLSRICDPGAIHGAGEGSQLLGQAQATTSAPPTVLDAQGWPKVVAPGPWTTQVAGYATLHPTVRNTWEFEFQISDASAGRYTLLRFGAVNYAVRLLANGTEGGQRTGAWTPFEFDVTNQLQAGASVVEVTVSYPPMCGIEAKRGYLEVPYRKQS